MERDVEEEETAGKVEISQAIETTISSASGAANKMQIGEIQ